MYAGAYLSGVIIMQIDVGVARVIARAEHTEEGGALEWREGFLRRCNNNTTHKILNVFLWNKKKKGIKEGGIEKRKQYVSRPQALQQHQSPWDCNVFL